MDDLRSAAQAVVDAEYGSVPLDGTLSTVITSELADLGAAIAALRAALDAAPPSGRGVFWDESAHVPDYTATLVRDGKGGVIDTKVYLPAPPAGLRDFVITTANGERNWLADDEAHAREQHADAFGGDPGEDIVSVVDTAQYMRYT